MVAKRKTTKTKEEQVRLTPETPDQAEAAPKQVVEVIEEGPSAQAALEVIKKDAEEIEQTAQALEEKTAGSDTSEETSKEEPQGKRKEVVEELFTTPSSSIGPEISEHKGSSLTPLLLWALLVIAVALLTGGGMLLALRGGVSLPILLAKPTPTPTSAPTPTPAAVQRSDIKVQVLNGGGTPGSAGKAKTFLEEKGYTVADVGNTDEYTYKETEIHVKAGKEAYLELLKADLADEYTVGTADAKLAADSSSDAQVIIGKE